MFPSFSVKPGLQAVAIYIEPKLGSTKQQIEGRFAIKVDGTCGWVELDSSSTWGLFLLERKVLLNIELYYNIILRQENGLILNHGYEQFIVLCATTLLL